MTHPIREALGAMQFTFTDLHSTRLGAILKRRGQDLTALAAKIQLLSEVSSRDAWQKVFGKAKHLMTIPAQNWVSSIKWTYAADWMDAYNKNDVDAISHRLSGLFHINGNSQVLFFSGPCDIIRTDWVTFCCNWISFAEFNDDGTIIFFLDDPYGLMFTSSGSIMLAALPQ